MLNKELFQNFLTCDIWALPNLIQKKSYHAFYQPLVSKNLYYVILILVNMDRYV